VGKEGGQLGKRGGLGVPCCTYNRDGLRDRLFFQKGRAKESKY
jgi:hypothetical protein